MSETGLSAFDTTLKKTNTWLREIMDELGTQDRHRAYLALRATLHALRDRLPAEEAVELGAQLPMLVRGFYYEGWKPASTPVRERHKREFLSHIHEAFREEGDFYPERVAKAVFKVMASHITRGELRQIGRILPAELHELWPG